LTFSDAESRNLDAAEEVLEALDVALLATDILAEVLRGFIIAAVDAGEATPGYYTRSAIFLLSVIGVRTARACVLVISAGYWAEAHGLKRRLSEVHARTEAVANDPSGEHARRWLQGKGPSTPHKVVGKWGSADLWTIYGWGAHADPASVLQWLSEPAEDVRHGIRVLPEHHETMSNAALVECAMECRDLAIALATARAATQAELHANTRAIATRLDGDIDAMRKKYYTPPDPAS
jgi:hypothetical protein